MNGVEEVELKFTAPQNDGLESSFREFYRLDSAPRIARKLILPMEEYRKFVKGRAKARTQFEADRGVDLNFDSARPPFKFIAVQTEFILPSGKSINVFERLTEPNGITEKVTADNHDFTSYFQAEQHVLEQFLKEQGA